MQTREPPTTCTTCKYLRSMMSKGKYQSGLDRDPIDYLLPYNGPWQQQAAPPSVILDVAMDPTQWTSSMAPVEVDDSLGSIQYTEAAVTGDGWGRGVGVGSAVFQHAGSSTARSFLFVPCF